MQNEMMQRVRHTTGAIQLRLHRGVILALILTVAGIPAARAVEVDWLYTVEVPFEFDDASNRSEAYRAALKEVLVRITGTTAAAESEAYLDLFPNPDRFVLQRRPASNETQLVSLDGQAIENILRRSGATIWGSDRPLTMVWMAVDWGRGQREIVAADDPGALSPALSSADRNQGLREQVQATATRRGLPVVFPLLDTEDLENVSFSEVWGGFDDQLLEASSRYQATSVLVARIRPNARQVPRWTWYWNGQRRAWPGEPEEAVDQLADEFAALLAFRGNQDLEQIELTISGIDSVIAYGTVQQYLENMRLIDQLLVRSVLSDRIVYEVEVQGGIARLNQALESSTVFKRVAAANDRNTIIDTRSTPSNENRIGIGMPSTSSGRRLEFMYQPEETVAPTSNPVMTPGN